MSLIQCCHIAAKKTSSERRIHVALYLCLVPAILYEQMTKAPQTSANEKADHQLDDTALNAIRSILTEDQEQGPPRPFSRKSGPSDEILRDPSPRSTKSQLLPELASPEDAAETHDALTGLKRWKYALGRKAKSANNAPVRASRADVSEPHSGIGARIKGYIPKSSYIALGVLVLFLVLRPWIVLGLLTLFFLALAGVFVAVGYDCFWQGVIKFCRWYAMRRPERAVILRGRLDRFAIAWDTILDRFPAGTVDGLYLPDFGAVASADARHAEAMERRLSSLQDKGA